MGNLKFLLLLSSSLISLQSTSGQALFTSFYEEYRIEVKGATTLLNGDIVVIADHNYNGSLSDTSHLIIRLDQDGEILWSNSKGHASYGCVFNRIIATADSGFAVVGSVGTYGYFAKWSKNNVEEAKVSFDHLPSAPCAIFDVAQLSNTRYVVLGETFSNADNKMVATFLTLNVTGSSITIPDIGPLQKYIYQNAATSSIYARRLVYLSDSTFALAGNAENSLLSGAGGIFFSAFNTNSNQFSVDKVYRPAFVTGLFNPLLLADFMAAPFPSYDYVAVANMPGTSKGILFKLSANGIVVWAKQLPGVVLNSGIIASDSTILVLGSEISGNENFIAKFESSGNLLWTKSLKQSFPSIPIGADLKKAVPVNNGYIITGSTSGKNLLVSRVSNSGYTACNDEVTNSAMDVSLVSEPFNLSLQPQKPANEPQTYTSNTYQANRFTLCSTILSTEDIANHTASVYPNPTQGNITVTLRQAPQTMYIYDLYGSLVQVAVLENLISNIALNPEKGSGIYFYSIVSKSGKVSNGKILKH